MITTEFKNKSSSEKKHKIFLTGPAHGAATALDYAAALQKEKYPGRDIVHVDGKEMAHLEWHAHNHYFFTYANKILVITDFDAVMQHTAENIDKKNAELRNAEPVLFEIMNKITYPYQAPVMILSADKNVFDKTSAVIAKKNKLLKPLFEGFNTVFDKQETVDVVATPPIPKKSIFSNTINLFK